MQTAGIDVTANGLLVGTEGASVFSVNGDVLVLTHDLLARLVTRSRELGRPLTHDETFAIAQADWPPAVDAAPGELEVPA